jgi:hypothetical protein
MNLDFSNRLQNQKAEKNRRQQNAGAQFDGDIMLVDSRCIISAGGR